MTLKRATISILIAASLSLFGSAYGQKSEVLKSFSWADSVLQQMSLDQKLGQLFILRAHSNQSSKSYNRLEETIRKYQPGGLCFFQGDVIQQITLTNRYQKASHIPLIISQDAEWGLAMRLKDVPPFPYAMTLGAIENNDILLEMAKEIGRHCNRVGVHLNFAPDVDVNVNPENPVINFRSFGEDPDKVTQKASLYLQGLLKNKVLGCAKHFPGHGDTNLDSHYALPIVNGDSTRLHNVELAPFRAMIASGLPMIMSGHLYVPTLDSSKNKPASLSHKILTQFLRNQMKFKGLIITDALEMKGVTDYCNNGKSVEVEALLAGNDILLLPMDFEKAISDLKTSVSRNELSVERIDSSVLRILRCKYLLGLASTPATIDTTNVLADIKTEKTAAIISTIAQEAITVIKNDNEVIPIQNHPNKKRVVHVAFGDKGKSSHFNKRLQSYDNIPTFEVTEKDSKKHRKEVLQKIHDYDLVIVSLYGISSRNTKQYGIPSNSMILMEDIAKIKPTILVAMGSPYALRAWDTIPPFSAIAIGYEDRREIADAAAQILFGGLSAKGKLPVRINQHFRAGFGITTEKIRLGYRQPSEMNINTATLLKVDSMALLGISKKAFPGCQILMAKDGYVFYNKTFGHHTYKKNHRVRTTDLYDVASITKIAATTLAIFNLYENNDILLDVPISQYHPAVLGSNKENLTIREILAHHAGLVSWIPFYKYTLEGKKNNYIKEIYSRKKKDVYTVRVAEKLNIHRDYKNIIVDSIINSPLSDTRKYRYSDAGFYLLSDIIESISGKDLDQYCKETLYYPLGLKHTTFMPRQSFPLKQIIPTENDRVFRKQLVHGDVHDQGAAMLGGISGHAGLFSTAEDLAVIMQLLLNGGIYGGNRFFTAMNVDMFTTQQFPFDENRRALGFDKPPIEVINGTGHTCKSVSEKSFGHSGFTGTYLWCDPENNSVFIFLSNRIHPSANNITLIKHNFRTIMHQFMYDAIDNIER